MADTYAIEDVGSMDRRGNSPPMDEPGAPLGGGRGQKYGASPDVRNAVMDYYKQDKKSTTANLSTLMNSAPVPDDGYGDPYGGGGGESVITLEEFQDLKRAIQTLVEAQASQRRGSRFKVDWKWYHILFLILFNDLVLIAVGSAIGSAFYNIRPLAGGSFSAGPIEVEKLSVNPEVGKAETLIQSTDDDASLSIRSMSNDKAQLSFGDSGAPESAVYTMQTHTRVGGKPSFMVMEGFESRLWVGGNGGRTDIDLNPSLSGKVYVNRDLSIAKSSIGTLNSSLTVAPGNNQPLHLAPSINAPVTVHGDMTLRQGSIGTMKSNLALSAAAGKNISVTATNGFMDVAAGVVVAGDSVFGGGLKVTGVISGGTVVGTENAEFQGDVSFGDAPQDALDFKGHFRSCVGAHAGIAGILGKDIDSCETSTMIFDADDDGAFFAIGVPNTAGPTTHHLLNFEADPMCSKIGRPPNFRRNGEAASWLEKPCQVLSSESKTSMLQEVGDLKKGNIVSGFGTAEVSGLTCRGASNLYGDATLGISLQNEIAINGHITSNKFVFDRDGDSVRYIITFPDPSDDDFQERKVDFPMETGTVLTSASSFSTLEAVGALSQGSLVTGFGAAEVASLLSTGFSHLSNDVQLGSTSSHELNIQAHITSSQMIFDANSDGTTITFNYPDPVLVSKTISYPDESGVVLTTSSDFSTLKAVSALASGSIVAGFGSAHVASLRSDGLSDLRGGVILGSDNTKKLQINGHVITSTIDFDANSDGVNKLTLFFPDPTQPHLIEFPQESGRLLTTTSKVSALEQVGALQAGSIVSGFGNAEVQGLTATGITRLNGGVHIGNDLTDSVKFTGRIDNAALVINHPNAAGDLTLSFPRPATDITISFPDETGEVITTVSAYSVLTKVGALSVGSIATGFGPISISSNIETTSGGTISADGLLHGKSNVQLGGVPEHEITIRGTVEVRGGAATVFSIDPMDGNTYVKGNLEIGGSIQALAAPFFVNAINTGSITELIADQGVVIEGIVFKDGGFALAKTDAINEYTEGQGVKIDGVLLRDGGVIAEAALVSTNPRGAIDLITAINEGRDYEMTGTLSRLKFKQYFQATPDAGSFAVDSGAITVGTESNWNENANSRDAFMGFSTVYHNMLAERVHVSANGDFAINSCTNENPTLQSLKCGSWTTRVGTSQFEVTQATGHVTTAGNVTIGHAQGGTRRLLVRSDDGNVHFDVSAGAAAAAAISAGASHDAELSIISGAEKHAKLRFVDPSPTSGAAFELSLIGAESIPTLHITDGSNVLAQMTVDQGSSAGNLYVTGHTRTRSGSVDTLLDTVNLAVSANTTLGDNVSDGISIFGHLTHENITFDHYSDGNQTLSLYFPEPSQSRLIEFPDENGRVLTTSSDISTLTHVGTLISGAIGDGFGSADVASLNSKGTTTLLSDVDLGDGLMEDGMNINAHIRESNVVFDANSDTANITFEVPDPTPPIPVFSKRCSTWDGTLVPVTITWQYDDVRKIDWDNITQTFPVDPNSHTKLINYNITDTRPYSWVNCAYNDTVFCTPRVPAPYSCNATYEVACKAATAQASASACAAAGQCDWNGVTSTCSHNQAIIDQCAGVTLTSDEVQNAALCNGRATLITGVQACTYKPEITPGCDPKAESADSAGYTCNDYHKAGYSCNDLVYVFGYDCPATCVTPTLKGDIGVDTGYGWLSLEQSLIDHRDAVKTLIDNAPSYTVSLPEETGTIILTECTGTSKAPGKCETHLPAGRGQAGDIYLGSAFTDKIYIPGIIHGFFTILGKILTHQAGTENPACVAKSGTTLAACEGIAPTGTCWWHAATTACKTSAMFATDRAGQRINKMEALRFQLRRADVDKTMTLTVAEQTANNFLALPDESGFLLSTSSLFSTLTTVGVLTGLRVGGNTMLDADVTVGNDPADTVRVLGTVANTKNVVCATTPTCRAFDTDTCADRSGATSNQAKCEGQGASCTWTAVGSRCTASASTNCGNVVMTVDDAANLAACSLVAGCVYAPVAVDFSGNEASDRANCEAQSECTYVAAVTEIPAKCEAVHLAACAALLTQANCNANANCAWNPAAGGSCAAAHLPQCAGVTLVTDHAAMQTACGNAGTCAYSYTAPVTQACSTRANTDIAMTFDGLIVNDDEVLHLAVAEPSGTHTLTLPDETGTILTTVSNISTLQQVGALSSGSLVPGFGSAHVDSLTTSGATLLNGAVTLGDSGADRLQLKGQIGSPGGHAFVFAQPSPLATVANTLTFDVPTLTANRTITLPDSNGQILTDQSTVSALTTVGALNTGSTAGTRPSCVSCPGNGCTESRISPAACAAVSGTYSPPTGFGDAFVQELTVVGNANLEGARIVIGSSAYSAVEIKGSLAMQQLTVDAPGGGGGKLSLVFIDPPDATDYSITFPSQSGQLLLDTSTGSSLRGLGAVNAGSIVEGFGPITTRSAISTTCAAGVTDAGCGPTVTFKGDVVLDNTRLIFSHTGTTASSAIKLHGAYSVHRVGSDGANTANFVSFPSSAAGHPGPDPTPGQMLVVENLDNRNLQIQAAGGGDLRDIYPGMVCTYFYIGARWVETARTCHVTTNSNSATQCKCSRAADADCVANRCSSPTNADCYAGFT